MTEESLLTSDNKTPTDSVSDTSTAPSEIELFLADEPAAAAAREEVTPTPKIVFETPKVVEAAGGFVQGVKQAAKDFWELPAWSSVVPRERIQELAQKYNTTEDKVEDLFALRGAYIDIEETAKREALLNASSTGDSILDFVRSPEAASIPRQMYQAAGGMANSATLGLPWKLVKESGKYDRGLLDEVVAEADKHRGKIQKLSELAVEMPLGAGAASELLQKAGVAAKWRKSVEAAKKVATGLDPSGLLTKGVSAVSAAAPVAAGSAAMGALAGYAASEKGEELDAMAKSAAMFAAFPFLATGGARVASYILAKPTSYIASKIGVRQTEALANFKQIAQVVESRAETESTLYDLATNATKFDELTEAEIKKVNAALGIRKRDIDAYLPKDEEISIVDRLDANRKAVDFKLRKELHEFATEFMPIRTNVRTPMPQVQQFVDEISGIDSIDGLLTYIKSNDDIPRKVKLRVQAVATADGFQAGKEKLMSDWFLPKTREYFDIDTGKFLPTHQSVVDFLQMVNKAEGKSPDYMYTLWKNYRIATELTKKLSGKVENYKYSPGESFFTWMASKNHVLDDIDRRWGIDELGYEHNKLMKALDKFAFIAPQLKNQTLNDLGAKFEKFKVAAGKLSEGGTFMYYQENSPRRLLAHLLNNKIVPDPDGALRKLTQSKSKVKLTVDDVIDLIPEVSGAQKEAFEQFSAAYKDAMEMLRQSAKNLFGVNIDKMENYFRHQLLPEDKIIFNVVKAAKETGLARIKPTSKKAFRSALKADGRLRDLLRSVKYLYQNSQLKSPKFATAEDLSDAIRQITMAPDQLSKRVSPTIYSAYQRTGGMPSLLRETDPLKVASSWIDNTLRAIFTREPIANISKYIPVLEKLGASSDAAWLKDYVRSALGRRADRTLFSNQTGRLREIKKLAETFSDDPDTFERVVNLPDQVASLLTKILHTSLLSSPTTALRNLEQVPFLLAPEIGGLYGNKITKSAVMDTVLSMHKAGKDMNALSLEGRIPAEFKGDIHTALENRPTVKGLRGAERVVDTASRVFMYLFGKGEKAMRLMTVNAGNRIADDILAGVPEALQFMNSVASPSFKSKMREFAGKKMRKELQETVGDYLIDRTMFHYNKANLARAAEFLGPLLSMFQRYSTEIMGDMMGQIKAGNTRHMLAKYLAPAIYVGLVWQTLKDEMESGSEGGERLKGLLGSRRSAHIPMAGGTGMLEMTKQRPVVVELAWNLLDAAAGKKEAVSKAVDGVVNLVPAYKSLQHWTDTAYTRILLGEDREEGPLGAHIRETIKEPILEWMEE